MFEVNKESCTSDRLFSSLKGSHLLTVITFALKYLYTSSLHSYSACSYQLVHSSFDECSITDKLLHVESAFYSHCPFNSRRNSWPKSSRRQSCYTMHAT